MLWKKDSGCLVGGWTELVRWQSEGSGQERGPWDQVRSKDGRVRRGLWPGLGGHSRLQKGLHGCQKFLGDSISFFFRFLSGNLARGKEHSAGQGVVQEGAWKAPT